MRNPLVLALALSALVAGATTPTPALGQSAEATAARSEIKTRFGFLPGFLAALPDAALPGAWDELKDFALNPNTALPANLKHAIGLAVAAQAGSSAWVYAERQLGKQSGASDAELDEAVVMAALTRHWSTVFHGLQLDLARFKAELVKTIEHAKSQPETGKAAAPAAVLDAKSARDEIAQSFGTLPEFMQRFPDEAIAGAWKEERDVERSAATALSGKHKSLVSLAVASQIPCRFCILADTEFAKLAGASEREIEEAIACAAISRHWITYVSGMELDEKAFRKDIDRIVGATHKTATAGAAPPPKARPKLATAARSARGK